MAIDIKGITCPQCGAANVEMTSDTRGVCKICGAHFTVQPVDEGIHIHLDGLAKQKDGECLKAEIKPEFTKEQFLRKVWLTLAAEDVPMEVFNEDFGEVQTVAHQVLMHSMEADVACQASVGYDREEPYTDYETYYEEEPYIGYEKQYDVDIHDYVERQVTKYRKVAKQRPVTKYKTVTDWSAWHGGHSTQSVAVVENLQGREFYEHLFIGSFSSMNQDSAVPVNEEAAAKMQVSKNALDRAMEQHKENISRSVADIVPGDHYRDLAWQAQREHKEACLFNATEYVATITFQGQKYTKRAFPFGKMTVGGDLIENPRCLDEVVAGMENKLYDFKRQRKDAIEGSVKKITAPLAYGTIALLVASILVSLLIRSTVFAVIMLIAAVIVFVLCELAVKGATSTETTAAEEEISAENARVRSEIDNYSENYKAKQLTALNGKLQSLGLKPATADDL